MLAQCNAIAGWFFPPPVCRPRVDAIVLQCESARALDQGHSFSYVQVNLSYITIYLVPLVIEELDVPIYLLMKNIFKFSIENVSFDW